MKNGRAAAQATSQPIAAPSGNLGPLSPARVLRILEFLSEQERGQTLADVCRGLSSPKSSVLSLLKELVALGYLVREDRHYTLGQAALSLATAIVGHSGAEAHIQTVLNSLSDKTGLTIIYSEFVAEQSVMLHKQVIQSTRPIRYVGELGVPRPLDTTAAGRAVLAFTDPAWCRKYLDARYNSRSRKTAAERKKLLDALASVRKDGYSSSLGDFTPGVGSFAAPVMDREGRPIASIGISGPEADVRAEARTLVALLPPAAEQISRMLKVKSR